MTAARHLSGLWGSTGLLEDNEWDHKSNTNDEFQT